MKSKILLSPIHISKNGIEYFSESLTNKVNNIDSFTSKFESGLETYIEKDSQVVALSSGTSALHLALLLLNIDKEDEVLCSTFTFSASANPITYLKAKPVFVDSELHTWNMNPLYLEEAIKDRLERGKKPRAIIVVDSYGMPAKWQELRSISETYNIPIIEDAAEALGSTYNEEKCGTFGDYSIISFNNNKIMTTTGGGALICRKKNQKERAVFLATQAKENTDFYLHNEVGYNYRMSPVLAGFGIQQMKDLAENIENRRTNNEFYKSVFLNINGIEVFSEPLETFKSNHWLNCITIDKNITGWSNKDLKKALSKENIESRFLWKPLHTQPVFKDCDYYGNYESETLFKKGLALPSGSNLTMEEKKRISSVVDNMDKVS